jgi:hypothetical protein
MSFITAYNKTIKHEGGYSPLSGGTYRGITRKSWGNWAGWKIIDPYLPLKTGSLIKSIPLDQAVQKWYKTMMWDGLKLDYIQDPDSADNLFDWYTTTNPALANKFMCVAFGIKPTGSLNQTLLNEINKRTANDIVNLRKSFYTSLATKNTKLKPFLSNWINRSENYTV